MLDKTFDPKTIETIHYKRWEQSGAFACDPQSSKQPYCIMIPPPNVTGTLHMGHAFTNTLQDILTRVHRMRGYDTLWQPGTDHAGIATQMVVERQLDEKGISRRDLGREEFVKKIWEWKEYSGGTITSQLRRMGATCDWSRERFTMDEGLSKAVLKTFVQLYKEGLIYKDKRLVNWDPKLQTAVSDLEVQHREIKGKMYHFRYPFEDGSGYVAVATTRPETILADGAVAVHPDDERYKDVVGKFVIVPVVNRLIPIIADDYVDPEFGSGAVKITAAHDFNDFEVYKRHKDKGIPLINLFTKDGKMNENAPEEYQGLDRFDARKKVIADFDELEYLDRIEDLTHQVPYGDRSGVVLEPYLTDQWYCDAATLAKPALEAVETGKTVFVPKSWENTYYEWMRNIQPWCISRQLWWGHQIPAWYDADGGVYVAESFEDAQKQANEKNGSPTILTRDEDVLDTWFSSALWPFSTLGWPDETPALKKYYPTSVLVTGFDILFFWVARMMMMGIHLMGEVPFKTVYMHALVRDAKGQKMSKSKGNVIDPLTVIDEYGTDALRFTLAAMAAQGRDIKLSNERVEGYRNFATKLWNAARYCEMNGCNPPEQFDPNAPTHKINQWIIAEVKKAAEHLNTALDAYRFNDAAALIYQFTWGTFCDWYLEFTKPLLNENNQDDALKQETRDTTGWVLDQILLLLNPFMPYITEELYESMAVREKGKFLFTSEWPDYKFVKDYTGATEEIKWVLKFISDIRSVRADMNVPAGAKLDLLVKGANGETIEKLKAYDEILRRMARLNSITLTDSVPKGSLQSILEEAVLVLPVADIIDLDKERARLKKEIEKLTVEIQKLDQRLNNHDFIAKADPETIEDQKTRKRDASLLVQKLEQAVTQLSAA